jgi:DNA-binding NarL/FixJ family response regulator
MAKHPCRILLADHHRMFRQALRALLDATAGVSVVGEVADGAEAVERARLLRPDVVLMEAHLPGRTGADAAAELRDRAPDARLILLGGDGDDRAAIDEAIRNGAMAYVPKTSAFEDLVGAIRQVARGHAALPPAAPARLVDSAGLGLVEPPRSERDGLTERELAVLDRVAEGLTNSAIAATLHIAESTVRGHLRSILAKLNASGGGQGATVAPGPATGFRVARRPGSGRASHRSRRWPAPNWRARHVRGWRPAA